MPPRHTVMIIIIIVNMPRTTVEAKLSLLVLLFWAGSQLNGGWVTFIVPKIGHGPWFDFPYEWRELICNTLKNIFS